RVQGRNWWQWVMSSSTAVHHLITDTRAASVVTDFLEGQIPEVPGWREKVISRPERRSRACARLMRRPPLRPWSAPG
ncbi:MAG: hypothetical protein M3T55_13710, partial [Pseudomonadota bacterium]|nr:hypothetical protein [Pseudomonadota bacterium]